MPHFGKLEFDTRGDREIVMTRSFNAARRLVFETFVRPEYVRRWLLGPDGWSMPVCEIDARVGGKHRYVWKRDRDGHTMATGGVFREVKPPERTVATEQFEEPWFPGEAIVTTTFAEKAGKTIVEMVMLFETKEGRDGALKSGMETGVERGYERLDDILAAVPAQQPG
ncbi:hypothetical protein BH10PSE9_BH10PSE9_01640 [soil metagenome]